ncbi:MAG: PSD1 and planctomycete cytochrome C domain-containing protein [Verrucomicrobiales bacterium]|nr:PSD1 and planctomycete cytochrome C domain-containing protein [Verrucomicrobiales bacterium]
MRYFLFIPVLLATLLPAESSADAQLEFFEKKIRPVLAEKCYSCHAADAKKLKGGLQLDHREHMLAGGDTGPALEPGDVEKSLLIESIRYGNDDLQMPPKEKLSAEIVADFETWIAGGAVWPEEPVPERDGENSGESFDLQKRFQEHWSWRPVANPDLPAVKKTDWPKVGPDYFVLAKMEAAGLRPAPEAEKGVWLRRVHFDLVGLPPTPEQREAFLADESPNAKEKVVDGLLASPHFGEKWARHWMDLVRYADTYGHEFDYPINGSHEYRDYLIRALNEDVPYDLFVKEHVAGDLLPEPRRHPTEKFNESILGTGFWYFHEATHAPTDVLGNEADIMDNQIDVFGKSFLGLTVSCARCHDHKFDAISTADYYAMTAYLHGSARQDFPMDVGRVREKTRNQLAEIKEKADALISPDKTNVEKAPQAKEGETIFETFSGEQIPEGWSTTGYAFAAAGSHQGVRFDEKNPWARPGTVDSGLFGKKQVGILRSPTFTIGTDHIHILAKGNAVDVRVVIDNYQMAKFSALLFKGTILKNLDTKGGFRWNTLAGNLKKYQGHKAYLEFVDNGDGEIVIDEIRFSTVAAPAISEEEKMLPSGPLPENVAAFVKKGEQLSGKLPAPRFAVAMAQGTPENAHVYVRGSHRSLGEEVPPRFLEALGGETGDRLDLANEVTRPDNPLTSRVLANRIWHHLFGAGIVPTVDDFGPMGRPATHPELLDWLATDLVSNGWSIKRSIRQLVLSSTYGQASEPHPELPFERLAEVDPSNELLSRMPVKRLTGEAVRDSILAVSGKLDSRLYGASVPVHRTAFMTGRGGKKSGPLDGAGRRSIYGAVYRNFLSPFMMTFDVPGPFGPKGRRNVSNVPAQALVLMNDPFVVEQTRSWAGALVAREESNEKRIDGLFLKALGRTPTVAERGRVESYLAQESESDPVDTWANLAHVVINMKEFIFIP